MSEAQFEKVCKGLECCILRDPDDHRRCGECPYNHHELSNAPCANGLKFNALALIRAQQERIRDLEERRDAIADKAGAFQCYLSTIAVCARKFNKDEVNVPIDIYVEMLDRLQAYGKRITEMEAAQQPRVMTADKVVQVMQGDVVWCESRKNKTCVPLRREGNDFKGVDPADYMLLDEVIDCDDYLKNYRFWDRCPMEGDMKAVKWNE